MKLVKRALRRDRHNPPLIDVRLNASKSHSWSLEWDEKLSLRDVTGRDGKTPYNYDLYFSADELALFVETALTGASKEVALHAQAKAIGAFIREALHGKHQSEDT